MNRDILLKNYARVLIECGVNLRKGQLLVLSVPVEHASFGRMLQETAYACGAGRVEMVYVDEKARRNDYILADEKELKTVRESELLRMKEHQDARAAFLYISSVDPDLMKGTDEEKNGRIRRARGKIIAPYKDYEMNSEGQWCMAALPSAAWARKVFPKAKNDEEAVDALYEAIFHTVYLDRKGDPVRNWQKHEDELRRHVAVMNDYAFRALHFKNELGTDLLVPLVDGHLWGGGSELASKTGQWFDANIPTEEIYTAPHRLKTEGKVVASRPLNHNGSLVEDFSFTFHKGKVTDFTARKGKKTLESILSSDDGSVRLGEVALVPFDSNISNLDILFYDTLFDENAACHLALGASYPTTIRKGEDMDKKQLRAHGMNTSSVHEDFMFGTPDLEADGILADGTRVPVFRKGNFVF